VIGGEDGRVVRGSVGRRAASLPHRQLWSAAHDGWSLADSGLLSAGGGEAQRTYVAGGRVVCLGGALEERFVEVLAQLDLTDTHGSAGRAAASSSRTTRQAAHRGWSTPEHAWSVHDASERRRGA
jgi:hypothetical protein